MNQRNPRRSHSDVIAPLRLFGLRLLKLRCNEVRREWNVALIFFLVSVDDGIVKSVTQAVFNIRQGVEHLPAMYTWIAVLFSLSMLLLSWLTAKVARQRLLFGLLGAVELVLILNTGLLLLEQQSSVDLRHMGFYSFLFISSEIARNLVGFQIWIVAGGICICMERGRPGVLLALLAASAILGDISGGIMVRFLGPVLEAYQLYGLAALLMALVMARMPSLFRRFFITIQEKEEEVQEGEKEEAATLTENLHYFGRSTYLWLLFVLSLGIFALYTAIHYGFNVIGRQHFPSEAEFTGFFGLFYMVNGIATLVFTAFLHTRLLGRGRTRSVYLGVCAGYALVAVALMVAFAGHLPLPAVGAIFAFNLINFLLLDSIVAPTYQAMMKVVPQRNTDGTRMIMEGGFMLLGGLVGAGLTALHAQGLLSLGGLFTVLFLLSALMVLCGWKLRSAYTTALLRALRDQDTDVDIEQATKDLSKSYSLAELSNMLKDPVDRMRRYGIEIARRLPGRRVRQVCFPLVSDAEAYIRSAALEGLNPDGASDEAIPHILPRLDDEDEEVRLSAARALSRMIGEEGKARVELNDERREEVIGEVLPRLSAAGGPASLRAEFLVIMGRLQHEPSATQRHEALVAMLESDRVEEIVLGIQAAGRMGLEAVQDPLIELLEHPHPAVREAAVRILGELESERGFAALMEMLGDPNPGVVEAAGEALSRTRDPGQRWILVEGLRDCAPKEWKELLAALIAMDDLSLTRALIFSCCERLVEANRYLVAIDLLDGQGKRERSAVPLLIHQLEYENRRRVLEGVRQLLDYLGGGEIIEYLLKQLHESPAARKSAIELLVNIPDDGKLVALLLPPLDFDREMGRREREERRVREELAARARRLGDWEEVDLEEALRSLLRVPEPWMQMATVWVLPELGYEGLADEEEGRLAPLVRQAMKESERGEQEMTGDDLPRSTKDKITFLIESELFASLPLAELNHIALSTELEWMKKGTAIIKEGEKGDKMYIVVRGTLEVRKGGQQIATLGEKKVVGDMALLDDEPRSASVVPLEDVYLLSLHRDSLQRILRRYSSVSFEMMRILSRRLRESMAAA